MNERTCTCGFEAAPDYGFRDHLGEVFIPADDVATDGRHHAEVSGGTCLCGFIAGNPASLDEHLLTIFTPADHIGRDGNGHGLGER